MSDQEITESAATNRQWDAMNTDHYSIAERTAVEISCDGATVLFVIFSPGARKEEFHSKGEQNTDRDTVTR